MNWKFFYYKIVSVTMMFVAEMHLAGGPGPSGSQSKQGALTSASKTLTVQEYKRRLRDNIKSLNDNFGMIMLAAKVLPDDTIHRMVNGRMADYASTKMEMEVRVALIIRACDELLKLTNDLKEFLVLHDFNFLTDAINGAEAECERRLKEQMKKHNELRVDMARIVFDMDKELQEHFCLKP